MQAIDSIFYVLVLIMSVVVHEFAHGYTAYRFGDNTARDLGRLTLNPLKHLDFFGSILLPLSLIVLKAGFVIGWARPVPYNPNNLRGNKNAELWVAVSGVIANLILVVVFGLIFRFSVMLGLFTGGIEIHPYYKILSSITMVNIVLAIFNLIPIPPLDGSKVLFHFLSPKFRFIEAFLEKWGMFVLLFFIIYIWQYLNPVIFSIFRFTTGVQ